MPREVRLLDIELVLGCDLTVAKVCFGPLRVARDGEPKGERASAGSIALSPSVWFRVSSPSRGA
jgi:hypothetical protein